MSFVGRAERTVSTMPSTHSSLELRNHRRQHGFLTVFQVERHSHNYCASASEPMSTRILVRGKTGARCIPADRRMVKSTSYDPAFTMAVTFADTAQPG